MNTTPEHPQADYYRLLQVEPTASAEAIERAYAAHGGEEGVAEAYAVLSDPERRKAYDQQRRQWLLEKVREVQERGRHGEPGRPPWGVTDECPLLRGGTAVVADERLGRVVTVGQPGQPEWEYAGLESPTAPTWAGPEQVLVCETGRDRVLLLDLVEHKPLREVSGLRRDGVEALPLRGPRDALRLPSGLLLVADTLHHRVIEIDEHNGITWQYGNPDDDPDSPGGDGDGELCMPVAAARLDNGHVLITDAGNARLLQVSPDGELVWTWPASREAGAPYWINFAYCLPSRATLVATDRVQEVDLDGQVTWEYAPAGTDIGRAYPLAGGLVLLDVTRVDGRGLTRALQAVDRQGRVAWEHAYGELRARAARG